MKILKAILLAVIILGSLVVVAEDIPEDIVGDSDWTTNYLRSQPEILSKQNGYYAIIGNFNNESDARTFRNNAIMKAKNLGAGVDLTLFHPDPVSPNNWRVMIAEYVSEQDALYACSIAKGLNLSVNPNNLTTPHIWTFKSINPKKLPPC